MLGEELPFVVKVSEIYPYTRHLVTIYSSVLLDWRCLLIDELGRKLPSR